jgi:hypothetical protein
MKMRKTFFFVFPSLSVLFLSIIFTTSSQSSQNTQIKKSILLSIPDNNNLIQNWPDWSNIEPGIEFKKINILDKSEEILSQLRLYRFNPNLFDIRVICSKNFGFKRTDVKKLAELSGSIAIINSSYFDVQGDPIAYLKCNGKRINKRIVTNIIYSGVFYVKHGRPYIVHRSNFNPGKSISDAVQVGPRLLSKGIDTIGLRNINAIHHRSGITLDNKGNVIIYATSDQYGGLSWRTLRYILKLKEIGAYDVLNLDGGGSTQMYISTKGFQDYIRGYSAVPSAIAIFYKE